VSRSSDLIDFTGAVAAACGAPFAVTQLRMEPLRQDEVLVAIAAAGICATDAHSRDQEMPVPLPAVLGHEGAGVVAAVGSAVTSVATGDRVTLSFPSCGRCRQCRLGAPANCAQGFTLSFGCVRADGSSAYGIGGVHGHFFGQSSFATYARATERNVVHIGDDFPFTLAGPLGCGIQTGAGTVLNSLAVPAGASLAVFGTGTVGLAAVMAAVIAGATTIVAVDLHSSRLATASELGATHTFNGRADSLPGRLRDIAPDGLDYVIEVTGSPAMLGLAVDALAPMGTAALVGGAPVGTTAAVDMNRLLNGGRAIRGVVQGDSVPQVFIPKLIELHRANKLPLERLVREYPFTDINIAFAEAAAGSVIKPVLVMP
jgi:aryl-alcohol dehydrogenase